jgi:cellulose synthase/poly-beta-1,6-N-acetylglucosamine synthase-like glycosyltransferase
MGLKVLEAVLIALIFLGLLPLISGCYQFALAGLHRFRRRVGPVDFFPRVAVVVPAWNEALVLERTIDQLVGLDYPPDRLRVYVIDDASTDATPDLVRAKAKQYPGRVFHLRRDHGGEGKSQTINHGLRQIRAEGWFEAILIIDADVIFTAGSLRRMTRHLADPDVGAVSAYIKEGSRPENYLNRFVAFEYITAQAGARRAQNLLGAQACLAGGAQLIKRSSLEAIGGEIDTTSLAEDTFTTLNIQIAGKRVVFEPHATVWAEEPKSIGALWKQRVRWGRGNVQVTKRFREIWLRRDRVGPLGGLGFALIWFSVFLMPLLIAVSCASLIVLFAIDRQLSIETFRAFWVLTVFTYLFVTLSSFSVDPETARRVWREGIIFPGLVSLAIIVYACYPPLFADQLADVLRDIGIEPTGALATTLLLFTYVWLVGAMFAAYLLKRLEGHRRLARLVPPLLYVVGYGPLLCAINSAAYFQEARGSEMRWEKTEKVGGIGGELG